VRARSLSENYCFIFGVVKSHLYYVALNLSSILNVSKLYGIIPCLDVNIVASVVFVIVAS